MTDPAQAFLNHGNVDQWSWAHEPLGPNIPHMASWTSDDVPSSATQTVPGLWASDLMAGRSMPGALP